MRFLLALAASTSAFGAERHNFILFVPEILPAASVEEASAPTLARLRTAGVNFVNSHSGFPSLIVDHSDLAADFKKESLMQTAEAARYSTLYVDGIDAQPTVIEQLRGLKNAERPFLIVYRISGNSVRESDDAAAAIEGSLKSLGLYDDTISTHSSHSRPSGSHLAPPGYQ